jgi:glutathione S-transferase
MAALTLYLGSKNYSSWSFRPWLALRHAGADFAEVVIPLGTGETDARIRAVNPNGKVPALRHERDGGSLLVWDSLAICEYAHELFPEAGLWPAEAADRARARSVSAEMHSGFPALREQFNFNMRARKPGRTPTAPVALEIARVKALWTECRAQVKGGGPFLFGAFSIADCMYAPVVSRFQTYGISLEGAAAEYAEAVRGMPLWKEWSDAGSGEPMIGRYEQN